MPELDLQQLSAWLADTDITLLELHGPGVHLRLGPDAATVATVEGDAPPARVAVAAAAAASDRILAVASSVGVFLHQHPQQATPLVRPGMRVDAGQTLGLLQIGSLLLPVHAAKTATLAAALVPHGTTVGYGTPLFERVPVTEAG